MAIGLLTELNRTLTPLLDVGLNYLTLERAATATALSGG